MYNDKPSAKAGQLQLVTYLTSRTAHCAITLLLSKTYCAREMLLLTPLRHEQMLPKTWRELGYISRSVRSPLSLIHI